MTDGVSRSMAAITARNDELGAAVLVLVADGASDASSTGGATSIGMHGNLNWRPAATMAWRPPLEQPPM